MQPTWSNRPGRVAASGPEPTVTDHARRSSFKASKRGQILLVGMGHHAQPREIGDLEQVDVRVDQVAERHVALDDGAVQRRQHFELRPLRDHLLAIRPLRSRRLILAPADRPRPAPDRSPPWEIRQLCSVRTARETAMRSASTFRWVSRRIRSGTEPSAAALEIRARLSSSTRSCDKASIRSLFFSPRSRLQITASNCPLRTR